MSTIEKLSIRGIRSFSPNREEIIEFYHPLTVLLGDNGCGKTTVIECLKLATTGGLPPGARSGQSLIHDPKIAGTNEIKASVRLRFRNRAGKAMMVQRTYQVRQTKKNLTFKALDGVIRVVNDLGEKVSLNHKCGELDQHIPDMLGVSKAILESVIFCHQEDSNWPLREGAELKKRFDNIFESARYTKALEAIRKLKKARNDDAKDYKRDLDVLTVNMKNAESIHEKIEAAQAKMQAAEEESEEGDEAIAKAMETLEELRVLQKEVVDLHATLDRRREDVGQKENAVKYAYSKMEKIMDDTDEELQELLNNYDSILDAHRKGFNELQEQEAQLKTQQRRAQDNSNKLSASKVRIETNNDINIFLTEFRAVVEAKHAEVRALDSKQRKEDEVLTEEVSKLTSKVERLRDELKEKTQSLETINMEKHAIATRLRDLSTAGLHSQRDAIELDAQTAEAEKALKEYKEKHDTIALKNEILGIRQQIGDINSEVASMGKQITQLRHYAADYTKLETRRSEYQRRLEEFQAALSEKVTEFQEVLEGGEAPTDRETLMSTITRMGKLVTERQNDCRTKKKELDIAQQLLSENVASAKLAEKSLVSLREKKNQLERQEIGQLKKLLEEVLPGHDLKDAELGVNEAEKAYADAKDKVVRRKNMVMFLNIYKKKGVKDHCCPLCERDMTPAEEQAFESILKDKTDDKKVADKITKAEALEKSSLHMLTMMREKIPSWRKWMEVEATLPEKADELDAIYTAQKALENDVTDKKTGYGLMQEQLEQVQHAKRELESLSKAADNLPAVEASIEKEAKRLNSITAGRLGGNALSLSDAEAKKDAKLLEVNDLGRQLERKQENQENINEMRQQLQADVHDRREEKLRMETQRKEYDDAVKEQNRLRDQEKTLRDTCSTLKQSEPVLEREARAKVAERKKQREEAAIQLRALRQELQEYQGQFQVFSDKCKTVQNGDLNKLERDLLALDKEIARVNQQERSATQGLEDLAPQMTSAQMNLRDNEALKRQIRDNLDYRSLKRELEHMRNEVVDIRANVEKLPMLSDVDERVDSADRALIDARNSLAEVQGKKKQLKENIRDYKVQLRVPALKDVDERYRQKLIQHETTQLAVADLDRYFKALDESLLQYHSKKVEEINSIIRQLWQITYKGQDIDTIELMSGQEEGTVSKAARSYDYRVVMKKGGVAIDMRGRCSAGQKVLAALVIRLALAETFCLNCGILALDEPTTNLDTENKFGLAQAITDILNARSHQQNFQLVCITHDEEFVQMLSRTQAMDGARPEFYWRIRREDIGGNRFVSKIERHEWEEGI
ncbi:DNA repair protein rad50 [Phytophthora boehmeriae]|uniref:DNA repair protein RAD50 n=1 Tax=Phytophthora boehmeriae TaxID=109152 RepID=A0A8T1X4H9_9STRA|nr:DNA repair protein rad50 [Phytophthora boehmeriae]